MSQIPDFKILYVDDEPKSLRYFKKIFSSDFKIITADSAEKALEILAEKDSNVGVLVADQRMPAVTGVELIQKVRAQYPDIVSLLITAFMDLDVALEAINEGRIFQYICKPWSTDSLKIVLLEAAQKYERKLHCDELEEKNAKLEEARRIQDRFIYTLSHEVRTPVGLSLNYSEELLESSLSQKQREYATSIRVLNQSLLSVLDNTLDYSMWEAGKLRLYEREFRLTELLERVEQSFRPQFKAAHVKFIMRSEAGMHDCLVGDPDRLSQILINLLSNAVKYSAAGKEIRLGIKILDEKNDRLKLRFFVKDQGEGIAEAIIDKLFQPFSQLQTAGEGNGLGLLISKELVTLMGGEIGVESVKGKGSEFWFEVEFGTCTEPSDTEKAFDESRFVGGVPVLLADDSAVGQALVEGLLSKKGYRIDIVDDGVKAVEKAKQNRYAVIILDCQMPEMNGLDATRAIRDDGLNQKTPIVGLTAMPASLLEDRWREVGLDEYVTKPLEGRRFLDTIYRLACAEAHVE